MGPLTSRLSFALRGSAFLAILLCCGGCRTAADPALFTVTGSGWRVREGQALWRPAAGMAEMAGDLVVATHEDGRSSVQFTKTPLPLALAQVTRARWLIHFPPRHLTFSGPSPAPLRFAWLHLGAALAGRPLPAGYAFEPRPEGGWRLANLKSGEAVEGYLSP